MDVNNNKMRLKRIYFLALCLVLFCVNTIPVCSQNQAQKWTKVIFSDDFKTDYKLWASEFEQAATSSIKIEGNSLHISFTHIGSGLLAKDSDLIGLRIAGTGNDFAAAKATIQGDNVVVSTADVIAPTNVRFGFVNIPITNLYNNFI